MEMNTKLVIFDFDGTLGDTQRNIVVTMQQVMRQLGLAVASDAVCASVIGLPLADCFVKIYPGMTGAEAERCAEAYRQYFFQNAKRLVPKPFPHVLETMAELKRMGVAMSIASSRTSKSLLGFVRDMGFGPYISHVVGCEDVEHAKPHPEPVLKTLAALNVSAVETLTVGDMPVDILMGRAAGTRTCAVTYGNADPADLAASGPDFTVDDIGAIIPLL